jgi:hypothetical protein
MGVGCTFLLCKRTFWIHGFAWIRKTEGFRDPSLVDYSRDMMKIGATAKVKGERMTRLMEVAGKFQ